jgi:hypothetical protein
MMLTISCCASRALLLRQAGCTRSPVRFEGRLAGTGVDDLIVRMCEVPTTRQLTPQVTAAGAEVLRIPIC